jgi:hypothetical protein
MGGQEAERSLQRAISGIFLRTLYRTQRLGCCKLQAPAQRLNTYDSILNTAIKT